MSETVSVCPDCESTKVRRRFPAKPTSTADHRWYCAACQTGFDAVAEREIDEAAGGRGGATPSALWDADPEEVFGDD